MYKLVGTYKKINCHALRSLMFYLSLYNVVFYNLFDTEIAYLVRDKPGNVQKNIYQGERGV
jgi:hypothetical protein